MTVRTSAARRTFCAALLLATAGCQTVEVRDGKVIASEAVVATWDQGYLFMGTDPECYYLRLGSEKARSRCLASGPRGAAGKVPAVVFLHGCAGWNGRQKSVMDLIRRNGYVVFAPDSFARPGRSRHCGQARRSGIIPKRLEETAYAVARIRQLPWVDPDRLVLAGFSEGGVASAEYSGDDFRAVLVLGWGCGRRGIRAPRGVAVLNLVGAHDDESSSGGGLCPPHGGPGSQAVQVNAGHDVSTDPAAAGIVSDFLRAALR